MISVTLNSTTFPTKGLQASPTVPFEPDRLAIGRISLLDRIGTYYTPVHSFAGPFGQEWFDMNSPVQGARSGLLNGTNGYLILPSAGVQEVNAVVVTTQAVVPTDPAEAHRPVSPANTQYRQFVGVGNTIWRSDVGARTFTVAGNPVMTLTGATQITSIVAQQRFVASVESTRLWASGASATGNHALWYSDNDGATWAAHGTLTGEQIAGARTRLGGRTLQATQSLVVARSDGSMYRTYGTGDTALEIDPPGPGRTVFLQNEASDPRLSGIWFIKGGRLFNLTWEQASVTRFDQLPAQYPDFTNLVDGVVSAGSMYVTDGWNIYELQRTRVSWIGLPPNLTSYATIRKLAIIGNNLLAVVTTTAGDTEVLAYPARVDLEEGHGERMPTFARAFAITGIPQNPVSYQGGEWTPVLAVTAQTGYAIHAGRVAIGHESIGTGFFGLLLAYDGTNSYVHSFDLPVSGSPPPGGKFPTSAVRVMPTFDGGMPDVGGTFYGVSLSWEFRETGGSATVNAVKAEYSLNNGSTWTAIGTVQGATEGAVRGTSRLLLSTAVSFRAIDIRLTIYRGATVTLSPRIFNVTYIWSKRDQLRYTFRFSIDVLRYMRQQAVAYDTLLATLKTLYDLTTPVTLTLGDLSTTYSVRLTKVTPEPLEAYPSDEIGDIMIECETV